LAFKLSKNTKSVTNLHWISYSTSREHVSEINAIIMKHCYT